VSSVTDMGEMFYRASAFNQNLCAWKNDIFVNNPLPSTGNMFLDSKCPNTSDPTSAAVCQTCNQ